MQIDAEDIVSRLITATEAATLARVSVSTICHWANPERGYYAQDGHHEDGRPRMVRKYLETVDRNERGRALYRYLDVVRAEQATRKRAPVRFPTAA